MARSFFFGTLAGTTSLIAAYLGFALIIDPFNLVHSVKPDRYLSTNQRFAKPAIARSSDFQSFVVGTSMSKWFPIQFLNERIHTRFANLYMGGATSHEQKSMLELLPRLDYSCLILEIYFGAYGGATGETHPSSSFPTVLYDRWRANDVAVYLSSSDFAIRELRLGFAYNFLGEDRTSPKIRMNRDGSPFLPRGVWDRAAAVEDCRSVDTAYIAGKKLKLRTDDAREMLAIASSKFERVYCYFNPISAVSLKQRLVDTDVDNLAAYVAWKETIVEICASYTEVALVDYQTINDVTSDVANYWDYNHYRESVVGLIFRDIASLHELGELEDDGFGELLTWRGRVVGRVNVEGLSTFDETRFYAERPNALDSTVVSLLGSI